MESQATTFGGKTNLGTRASSNNNTEIEDVEDEISEEKQMIGIDRKLGRRNSELNLRDWRERDFYTAWIIHRLWRISLWVKCIQK